LTLSARRPYSSRFVTFSLATLLRPAPPLTRRLAAEVERLDPRFRWRILESRFIGYAVFYFVRDDLPVVSKEMGAWSGRSNPRDFMSAGLLLTALCNFAFGAASSYGAHLELWTLNGFVQGMGWGPCGRSPGHWYRVHERGRVRGLSCDAIARHAAAGGLAAGRRV
jgi:OPA family glycerol-3-phosphate transporter-like MFS transporter